MQAPGSVAWVVCLVAAFEVEYQDMRRKAEQRLGELKDDMELRHKVLSLFLWIYFFS